jgi:LacI family transcriptional regulator
MPERAMLARIGHRAVSIRDVAQRAGVSPSTVSKALNGAPHVTTVTRNRVLEAAGALGYRPNSIARSLKTKRTRTIGLITDDLGDAFTMPMMRGVEIAASEAGVSVFLCNSYAEPERERSHLEALLDKQVDAIILMSGYRVRERGAPARVLEGLPVVYLYQYTSQVAVPCIVPDDVGGGALAAEHLLEMGHTRVAMVNGPPHFQAARDRVVGFRSVLERTGIGWHDDLVSGGDWSMVTGYQATRRFLERPVRPTAIFCASDVIAIGAIAAAYERQLRVPEDLSIVGFDDRPLASQAQPPLTTIALPLFEMGHIAGAIAVRAKPHGVPKIGTQTVPCSLVRRSTTAPPPHEARRT